MTIWEQFHGVNAGYVQELYERYQQNPDSVDPTTREIVRNWGPPVDGHLAAVAAPGVDFEKVRAAVNLVQAIREYGHLGARLDPLGSEPPGDPALKLQTYGLSEADLRQLPAGIVDGPIGAQAANGWEAIRRLHEIYTGSTGHDYEHIRGPEERQWLREAIETQRFRPPATPIDDVALLDRLTQVEVFEHFLHRFFPGKTRFSIEGLDMMVPMLDEIVV